MKNNSGQALFELIFFLPIFVLLIPLFISIGNSFNMSINQQKVTRRYFYFLARGNSKLPSRLDLKVWSNNRLKFASMTSVSYADIIKGEAFYASCSPISKFLRPDSGEECESKLSQLESETSGFIRIFTSYGICGTSYGFNETSTDGSPYSSSYLNINSSRITDCSVSE